MKNQNGITLIALVVTIIVLLILAGVAIAMLSGENGLLKQAKDAAEQQSLAVAQEKIALAVNAGIASYYDAKYVDNDASASLLAKVEAELATVTFDAYDGKDTTATLDDTTAGSEKLVLTHNGNTYNATINATTGVVGAWAKQ